MNEPTLVYIKGKGWVYDTRFVDLRTTDGPGWYRVMVRNLSGRHGTPPLPGRDVARRDPYGGQWVEQWVARRFNDPELAWKEGEESLHHASSWEMRVEQIDLDDGRVWESE